MQRPGSVGGVPGGSSACRLPAAPARHLLQLPAAQAQQHPLRSLQQLAGRRSRRACLVQAQAPVPRRSGDVPVGGAGAIGAAAGAARPLSPAAAAAGAAGSYAAVASATPAPPAVLPPEGGSNSGPPAEPADDEPELVLLITACGIGLATGAAIVLFNDAVHVIRDVIWDQQSLLAYKRELLRNIGESELWPKVVFPPLVGGLVVGALGFVIGGYDDRPTPRLKGRGSGSGSSTSSGGGSEDEAGSGASASAPGQWKLQAAAVLRPVARAVAAAVTLGTGASLGPEGPSVDIGKSTAQALSSSLRSKQRHLTSLLAAGAGAGVAAGFNAPISGVFFAVETVLQRQKVPRIGSSSDPAAAQLQLQEAVRSLSPSALTIAMVLLAAVLAAVVSQAGLGSSPAFRVPEYRLESLYELPLYLIFGAICGVVSASCSFSTRVATDAFDELREQNSIEAALMPCIGGLTTGVLALGYPEILYQGFDNVNNILSSNGVYAPGLLIQIVVMKVIATSICRGSGLQGGLYAPSIFIGAALGTAFGLMAHAVGDPVGLQLSAPQAYALVGVAAMLASNCSVPLTSVLLLFELTHDYLIILPTLAAVGISFWISSLAAPSVKSTATARRMSAAAAASAAVATTQLKPAATEAVLVGSLPERLDPPASAARARQEQQQQGEAAAAAATAAAAQTGAGPPGFASFDAMAAAPAQLAAAAARAGERSLPVSAALERSCLLVEGDMGVQRALELMQADDQHVAVVLGDDGSVMGLVTRNVLEQCVQAAAQAGTAGAPAGGSGGGSGSGGSSDGT